MGIYFLIKIMFKYILMPIVMPLRGLVHTIDKGAARFVDAIQNNKYQSGGFYASVESKVTGDIVDQFEIYPVMANPNYQDNAHAALHRFIK